MKDFFTELFEYNCHYNQKLADLFLLNLDKASDRSVKLFNHILNAHQIWNGRIEPDQNLFGVWDIHPAQDFIRIDKMNHEHSLLILEKYNMNQNADYKNGKGQCFSKKISDILFHIINHSTYHKGQIAAEFRQSEIEPIVTDYIFYKK